MPVSRSGLPRRGFQVCAVVFQGLGTVPARMHMWTMQRLPCSLGISIRTQSLHTDTAWACADRSNFENRAVGTREVAQSCFKIGSSNNPLMPPQTRPHILHAGASAVALSRFRRMVRSPEATAILPLQLCYASQLAIRSTMRR